MVGWASQFQHKQGKTSSTEILCENITPCFSLCFKLSIVMSQLALLPLTA